jgi:hypothetical protein
MSYAKLHPRYEQYNVISFFFFACTRMMRTQVEEVDELDETVGEIDSMVSIIEEDEVLLLWNNREV